MKRILALILTIAMAAALTGCAGTTVVIGECTCPTEGQPVAPAEGALKTGLSVSTDVSKSVSAAAEAAGAAEYDVTLAAVTVDDNGVISGLF